MSICRLCLQQATHSHVINLNNNNIESSTIRKKLAACVPDFLIDLVEDHIMCTSCLTSLNVAYNLKHQCLKSDAVLITIFCILNNLSSTQQNIATVIRNSPVENEVAAVPVTVKAGKTASADNGCSFTNVASFACTAENNISINNECAVQEDINMDTHEREDSGCKRFDLSVLSIAKEMYRFGDTSPTETNKPESFANNREEEDNLENAVFEEPKTLKRAVDANSKMISNVCVNDLQDDIDIVKHEIEDVDYKSSDLYSNFVAKCKSEFEETLKAERNNPEVLEDAEHGGAPINMGSEQILIDKPSDFGGCPKLRVKRLTFNVPESAIKLSRNANTTQMVQSNCGDTACSINVSNELSHPNQSDSNQLNRASLDAQELDDKVDCLSTSTALSVSNHLPKQKNFDDGDATNSAKKLYSEKHVQCRSCRCSQCKCSTNKKPTLVVHTNSHSRKKRFKCNISLKRHLESHTKGKIFKCDVCNYNCSKKSDMSRHMIIHTVDKPFKCEVCNYICSQQSHLRQHVKTHTDEKPFKCAVCNSSFSQNSYLKVHMKTHTGERPFKCDVCNYNSNQKSNLSRHMITHTREKPFKCAVCDYNFSQKSYLKLHIMKTHGGEGPFKCDVCNYNCSRKGSLNRHMRTHTGERPS